MFDEQKRSILSRMDRSKKGGIDKAVIPLVSLINSKKDYFTTSSCSGRILLMALPDDDRKYNAEWLFLSHDEVTFRQIKSAIGRILSDNAILSKPDKGKVQKTVWFREESMIMHICCRTMEDASRLIEIAKHVGFKRSGIITASKKIIVETLSTESIAAPVIKEGKLLVEESYLKILANEANKKLKKTKEKIKRFTQRLRLL